MFHTQYGSREATQALETSKEEEEVGGGRIEGRMEGDDGIGKKEEGDGGCDLILSKWLKQYLNVRGSYICLYPYVCAPVRLCPYVCAPVCLCPYVCAPVCLCPYVCAPVCLCPYVCAPVCLCPYVCAPVCLCPYVCAPVCLCPYVCAPMYAYVPMYVLQYAYVPMYVLLCTLTCMSLMHACTKILSPSPSRGT